MKTNSRIRVLPEEKKKNLHVVCVRFVRVVIKNSDEHRHVKSSLRGFWLSDVDSWIYIKKLSMFWKKNIFAWLSFYAKSYHSSFLTFGHSFFLSGNIQVVLEIYGKFKSKKLWHWCFGEMKIPAWELITRVHYHLPDYPIKLFFI